VSKVEAKSLENLVIKGANKRLEVRICDQSGRGIFALQNISPGIFNNISSFSETNLGKFI